MPKLSAVIITQNEERNIGRCIDSLKGVADDIVVVDSGSTDNTEVICKEKGARFFYNKWEGYIEQKNFANDLAEHKYILSIDADEALSGQLRDSILEAKITDRIFKINFLICKKLGKSRIYNKLNSITLTERQL